MITALMTNSLHGFLHCILKISESILNPVIMLMQHCPLRLALFFSMRKSELQGPPSVTAHPPAPVSMRKHSLSAVCWKINRTQKVGSESCRGQLWDGSFVVLSFAVMCMFSCYNGGAPRSSPWLGLCRGVTWGEIG